MEDDYSGAVDGELETALRDLRACISSGDSDTAEMLLFGGPLDDLAILEEPWSDALFQGVIGLMRDEQFLRLETSWKVLYLFTRHWDNVSAQQREQLGRVLGLCFDRFQNWMGAYLVAEMMGERYADEGALASLDAVSRHARMPHRALAPYGLGQLARTVRSGALYDRAVDRLRTLGNDEAEEVRAESIAALRKLGEM